MLVFTNTITIEAPLTKVFAFVADQRNSPMWNYYVIRVEQTNDRSGVGSEFLQQRKNDQQRFRIEAFEENRCCVVQTLPGERPAVRRELRFEGAGGTTMIRDRMQLLVPLPGILSPLLTTGPRKAVARNLDCLKALLETGRVELPDGRIAQLDNPEA